ncbi:hypothetical protein RGU72_04785 [Undibacterium sp. 5I1]|uniref:hypothetical protein n=1 Tax=unclassified Undibacterium TaxID=2630295 RepID=UPI002AB549C3|nr:MULTISPECIES: hypothetical protein [unclassified Undibacterium]MDY7537568.1 hypothetical protein [Undibacterium sp. 5I1]MEB0231953.1 hypothetical protein [Undibacterium sp. 10I3]MEB0256304.1 hypothetical protein [Undibacterium sp. 5I1]
MKLNLTDKYEEIINTLYVMSAELDLDENYMDILSDPESATQEMIDAMLPFKSSLMSELETQRLKLAACGVCAMSNTVESTKERLTSNNPYYSASYADVCRTVDAEIRLRTENADLKARLDKLEKDRLAADKPELGIDITVNTMAGFFGAFFVEHGRKPSEQEIFNAGRRSGLDEAKRAE